MKKQNIKWLLFHEPAELFIRTAEHFGREINRLTGDQYTIEILKSTTTDNLATQLQNSKKEEFK